MYSFEIYTASSTIRNNNEQPIFFYFEISASIYTYIKRVYNIHSRERLFVTQMTHAYITHATVCHYILRRRIRMNNPIIMRIEKCVSWDNGKNRTLVTCNRKGKARDVYIQGLFGDAYIYIC